MNKAGAQFARGGPRALFMPGTSCRGPSHGTIRGHGRQSTWQVAYAVWAHKPARDLLVFLVRLFFNCSLHRTLAARTPQEHSVVQEVGQGSRGFLSLPPESVNNSACAQCHRFSSQPPSFWGGARSGPFSLNELAFGQEKENSSVMSQLQVSFNAPS